MAVHYRSRAFFLKKEDLREADQVFIVYTKEFGKLRILARAIRKIKSKLRAGAGLFYLSEIEFIQGKNHKTLTDATAIDKFGNIGKSLEKLKTVSQIAELVDGLIKGEEQDKKTWELLTEIFNNLNNHKLITKNQKLFYHYFLWNFLSILGYQIDLYRCAVCQKKLVAGENYFEPEQGIICPECRKEGEKISPDLVKILRLFLTKNWKILARLKIGEAHQEELEKISGKYLFNYRKK